MPNIDEAKLNQIVEDILNDYNGDSVINKVNNFEQPDKEVIIEIISKLQQLVFPGFFRNKIYRSYTTRNSLTTLLEDVLYNLNKQIVKVLRYDPQYEKADISVLESHANDICMEFLSKIPHIREYIATDVEAAYDGDPAAFNKDEIIYSYPGLYAITVNRLAHELFKLSVPLIPRIMTEHAHSLTGIDIHPGATIGKYFFIDHGTGIVVGETTVIGDNVKIYQGVTLGALSTKGGQKLKSTRRHPTIENNVTIYSGASILGGETIIGEGAVIGGNAFITTSIPAGTRVSIKTQELTYKYSNDDKHITIDNKF